MSTCQSHVRCSPVAGNAMCPNPGMKPCQPSYGHQNKALANVPCCPGAQCRRLGLPSSTRMNYKPGEYMPAGSMTTSASCLIAFPAVAQRLLAALRRRPEQSPTDLAAQPRSRSLAGTDYASTPRIGTSLFLTVHSNSPVNLDRLQRCICADCAPSGTTWYQRTQIITSVCLGCCRTGSYRVRQHRGMAAPQRIRYAPNRHRYRHRYDVPACHSPFSPGQLRCSLPR